MKDILKVLASKQACNKPPIWLMRQAGRYLPEYRKLREEKGSFLNLVYSPKDACEVTMQPIRRYSMDGAILFSDILIIPHALGLSLEFKKGEGPVLDTIQSGKDFTKLHGDKKQERYNFIYQTVSKVKHQLEKESFSNTALIGFAGAPWTVACYAVQGHGKSDFPKAIQFMRNDPEQFQRLIDILTEETIEYLSGQIEAGAEVIKLFESWANLLTTEEFEKYCVLPAAKIRASLKQKYPNIPFIGFAKTEKLDDLNIYSQIPNLDCMALSPGVDIDFIKTLPATIATQGFLSPESLLSGGEIMKNDIVKILEVTADRPHIFNLGHGVIKETKPENVAELVEMVRA